LPGGVGTFEEIWETVSAKSLGFQGLDQVPVVILNIDGSREFFFIKKKHMISFAILLLLLLLLLLSLLLLLLLLL